MNEFIASILGVQPNQIASMLPDLLRSFSLDLALKSVGLYVLIVWIAFVIWIVRDISNRTSSILLQTFSILVVVILTPIFGLPIYLLIRPRSTLFERYYQELELAEAEYEESHHCPACGGIVEADYRYCPHCKEELLEACASCDKLVQKEWTHCPYCGNPPKKSEKKESKKEKASPKKEEKTEEVVEVVETPAPKAPEKDIESLTSIDVPTEVEAPKKKSHSIVAEDI